MSYEKKAQKIIDSMIGFTEEDSINNAIYCATLVYEQVTNEKQKLHWLKIKFCLKSKLEECI